MLSQDDLDIQLDEPVAGLPPSIAQRSTSQQFPPARQSSTGAPAQAPQPGMPAVPGPRPPPGAPGVGLTPRPGVAPPRPPPGPPPPGHPATAPSVVAPPPMPSQWPRPQFVHTGAGMCLSLGLMFCTLVVQGTVAPDSLLRVACKWSFDCYAKWRSICSHNNTISLAEH